MEQVQGDPEDRALELAAAIDGFQDALATCMERRGFEYARAGTPTVTPSPVVYEPAWWREPDVELARETGLGFTLNGNPAEPPMAYPEPDDTAYLSMTPRERAAHDGALDECLAATPDPAPPASDEILSTLSGAMNRVTRSPEFAPIRDEVSSCLAGRGVGFSGPEDVHDAAEQAVGKVLWNVAATDPRLDELLAHARAAEVALAVAEAECRRTVADEAAALLEPVFDDWYEEHRDRLGA